MSATRAIQRWPFVLGVTLLALVAGCGLPSDGSSEAISASDVPYGLLDDDTSSAIDPPDNPSGSLTKPEVFWVDDRNELVGIDWPVKTDSAEVLVQDLLDRLVDGPSDTERLDGLGSALGADVGLSVATIDGTVVVIDVKPATREPSADRLPLAVGQVVLSATSVPGVEGVRFTREGAALEVPLPNGVLTPDTLTARAFRSLRAASAQ